MAKAGQPKTNEKSRASSRRYDNSHKSSRQIRNLRKDVPRLAMKILTGDYTRMKLYGGSQVVDVQDPAAYNPVLKERDVLVARLENLVDNTPDWKTVVRAEDATAQTYPQLAKDLNARAFDALPSDVKAQTTKSVSKSESTSETDIGVGDGEATMMGKSLPEKKSETQITTEVGDNSNVPETPTSRSAKRALVEENDQQATSKRPQYSKTKSVKGSSGQNAESLEQMSVTAAKILEEEHDQDNSDPKSVKVVSDRKPSRWYRNRTKARSWREKISARSTIKLVNVQGQWKWTPANP